MGLAFAAPVSVAVAGVVGAHPRGDGLLWERGGHHLVETARLLQGHLGAPLAGGGLAWFVLTFGWLVCVGALVAHVGEHGLGGAELVRRGFERFAPLTLMFGATLVGQVVVIGGAAWLSARLATPDRAGDLLRAGVVGSGLLLAGLMAIGHDTARVVCVQRRPRTWPLINQTFARLLHRPGAIFVAAAWRAGLAWLTLVAGMLVTTALVRGSTAAAWLAIFVQLVVLCAYVGLRASWFAWLTRHGPAG